MHKYLVWSKRFCTPAKSDRARDQPCLLAHACRQKLGSDETFYHGQPIGYPDTLEKQIHTRIHALARRYTQTHLLVQRLDEISVLLVLTLQFHDLLVLLVYGFAKLR